ncbi:hypothetical protein HOE31_02295 [bacterium]|jgi:hypothetical protein|nr:hypothetical protein [bacterium]MBT4121760.1 hypothetical protein [bacterium]MBT4334877.1 hypothetical protein [bacterium]MBT4495172.1 hypothetical protein [bacterium]MBT4763967.1 hypothetical protein [bacterium]
MRISALQKYILIRCYGRERKVNRKKFFNFYNKDKKTKEKARIKIITKSIERLINKGLIVGFGERTQHKWYISDVQLTVLGKKVTKKLLGEQIKLPLKRIKKYANIKKIIKKT